MDAKVNEQKYDVKWTIYIGSIQLSHQGSPSPQKIHYYKGGNINSNFKGGNINSNFILEKLGKHHFN